MATKYVNSGASGANNGTSWTDAWTSLGSAVAGCSAGDTVKVHKTHDEIGSIDWSLPGTLANPLIIICVDKDSSDSLSTGAAVGGNNDGTTANNLYIRGHLYCYGIIWRTSYGVEFYQGYVNTRQIHEYCTFKLQQPYGGYPFGLKFGDELYGGDIELRNCTLDFTNGYTTGYKRIFPQGLRTRLIGCTLLGVDSPWIAIGAPTYKAGVVEIEDMDISSAAKIFIPYGSGRANGIVRRCKLHASYDLVDGSVLDTLQDAMLEACQSGTITVPPLGLSEYEGYYGTVKSTIGNGGGGQYRTGGADDGLQANAHAWEMATNANAKELYCPLKSPPITRWVIPSGSISGATAKGICTYGRALPLVTHTALTTDGTSAWNGTGVGTKQKVSVTLSNGQTLTIYLASGGTLYNDEFWIDVEEPNQVGGPVLVCCYLAKPNTTVYVDPKIEIGGAADGLVRFVNGIQTFDEASAGGGTTVIVAPTINRYLMENPHG